MSKATSRSVNKYAISTIVAVILTAVIVGSVAVGATYAYFALQSAPGQQLVSQPKPALEKFKVSAYSDTAIAVFLVIDVGKDKGIWARNGLDPEWVTFSGRSPLAVDLKEHVASGIKLGISNAIEPILASSRGTPIKIVAAYVGELYTKVYVKADGPIKTIQDLDGKKVGVYSPSHTFHRQAQRLATKTGITVEPVNVGNTTANQVAALKIGRIDAFINGDGSVLRLVDSGELRILFRMWDIYPKPFATFTLYATDELIRENPDLVKRFVRAWLDSVRYITENPNYAAELLVRRINTPKDLADKIVGQITWTPSGRGSVTDLVAALRNNWQALVDDGAILPNVSVKFEDAVDIRFLP